MNCNTKISSSAKKTKQKTTTTKKKAICSLILKANIKVAEAI